MRSLFLTLTGWLLALSGQAAFAQSGETSEYVFITQQSTITRTGGIAGVQRTYSIEGRFQVQIDPEAGVASFLCVDANAVDDSDDRNALDPNEVFNLTGLAGAVMDETTISFEGKTDDGSSVLITLTFADGTVVLNGVTTPPPNSADFFIFALDAVAQRKYAGGAGTADDPYQIATAADLIGFGETLEDYDKHFILTADIDLDPNLPDGKVFDKAVIAPDTNSHNHLWDFDGVPFAGALDGDGHTIIRLTIDGGSYLGLFGRISSEAEVKDVGLVGVTVTGYWYAGGLAGSSQSAFMRCYSTGTVSGTTYVGGLVGSNKGGILSECHSNNVVKGCTDVGGLVGYNWDGVINMCCSTGSVSGEVGIGGLVGWMVDASATNCYSNAAVTGTEAVGGFAGARDNDSQINGCYSTGAVDGATDYVGGFLGRITEDTPKGFTVPQSASLLAAQTTLRCFWDRETSGQMRSAGGSSSGCDTPEMKTAATFVDAGWDFVGETANGTEDIWWILEGRDYPRLWWQLPTDDFEDGQAGPLWFVYEMTPEWAWLEEVNGRLEAHATGQMEDVDAVYVSDGWRLDATKAFAVRVDFHFSKVGVGDGRVTLGLVPAIELPVTQWAQFEVGAFDANPFYLYEVRDGVWVEEEVAGRLSDDGTLYVSYDAETDELHLSDTGYGQVHARWTVAGLVQGRWQSGSVYVTLGGGSEDGMALTGEDAWLDNFAVDGGAIVP